MAFAPFLLSLWLFWFLTLWHGELVSDKREKFPVTIP